jgi:alpha-amylase
MLLKTQYCVLLCLFLSADCSAHKKPAYSPGTNNEVIYHVFVRSFYDSNGDGIGDLNGLGMKLDYLQDLGITSILLLPICKSDYYHNYFSADFFAIDPEYGTMTDYLRLVKDVHRRGMKIYLDMETQYVTDDHPWFADSYKNPSSPYSNYILYRDAANTEPEPILHLNLFLLPGYNNITRKVTTVNLLNKNVQEYNQRLYGYWTDPDKDGKFDDGADGFRLDHMMDDLDHKHKLVHLFNNFWKPLFTYIKNINPRIKFIAEQADGGFGFEYFQNDVDGVFAFVLQYSISSFDKNILKRFADTIFSNTPAKNDQVIFIENHDLKRFATAVENNPAKMKIGAALNLLMGGVPSIYYGQEIGMKGKNAAGKYGPTDASDIPVREAFEWYRSIDGKGMATWYKGGPWWDDTNLASDDGVSLEEEKNDPHSLFSFYKKMIGLRESNPVLVDGKYETLENNNDHVYTFLRYNAKGSVVVIINFSDKPQDAIIVPGPHLKINHNIISLEGDEKPGIKQNKINITMQAYGIEVVKIK